MPQLKIIAVTTKSVSCDGGVDKLGHPRVYLAIKDGKVDCPYCGRRFVLAADAKTATH